MKATFRRISQQFEIPMKVVRGKEPRARHDCAEPHLVFVHNGSPSGKEWTLEPGEHRILHLIRDPRDIVISGMHFHASAEESWLSVPNPKLGGLSYKESLKTKANLRERYDLEMLISIAPRRMGEWDYRMPHAFEAHYEDLMADTEGALFGRIAAHLGFDEYEIEDCRTCFVRSSLFGGVGERVRANHVRSGEARQWAGVFDRPLAEAFVARYGDVLIKTGYEPDHGWIGHLPERNPALDAPCQVSSP